MNAARLEVIGRTKTPLHSYVGSVILVAATAASAFCGVTSSARDQPSRSTVSIPAHDGPGVTDTTISLASAAFYGSDASYDATFDAVVRSYNAEGGIAGRKVQIAAAPLGKAAASQSTPEAIGKAICAGYRASARKFLAALDAQSEGPCLNDIGTAAIYSGYGVVPASEFVNAPLSFAPNAMTDVRAASTLVERLAADGFFTGARDVAIFSSEFEPEAVVQATRRALEAAGVPRPDVVVLPDTGDRKATQINAVVRMKRVGYDRIVAAPGDATAWLHALLPVMAEQRYTPKIGAINMWFDTKGSAVPSSVWRAITAYGWGYAYAGVPREQVLALSRANPAARRCIAIPRAAHLPVELDVLLSFCDQLNFIKSALAASGSEYVNAEAIAVGSTRMKDFRPTSVFAVRFTPGQPDGVAAVRRLRYSQQLDAFEYVGHDLPVASTR